MNKLEYKNLVAFHPGYYIKEMIDDMEISQEEFANRLGVSGKTVSKLINGKINLSNDVALQLSLMFGTSAEMWMNLQHSYEIKCAEIKKRELLDNEIKLLKMIDYDYFSSLGFVELTKDPYERIKELCNFFKISRLSNLLNPDVLVNFRTGVTTMNDKNIINSKAWLQTVINIGRGREVNKFNLNQLKQSLPEIRKMTLQDPDIFLPRLKEIFSECGVTFVLLPHLKNSGINGAVKWINNEKVILAMNDRRNYADTFWFSLFHEIKHVLQQKHKLTLISFKNKGINQIDQVLEEEADRFAQDILIPRDEYDKFVGMKHFSEQSIEKFAAYVEVHPGIVVGRLQNDGYVPFSKYNSLKLKYKINVS